MLTKGTKAPYFEGNDENGNLVKLSDFAGKKLVLYFIPRTVHLAVPPKRVICATTTTVFFHWVTRCLA